MGNIDAMCRKCYEQIHNDPYDIETYYRTSLCLGCSYEEGIKETVEQRKKMKNEEGFLEGIQRITKTDYPVLVKKGFTRITNKVEAQVLTGVPGIYILWGKGGEPLYIGKSTDLRTRIRTHIMGSTNTKRFQTEIVSAGVIVCESSYLRELYETFLIHEYEPINNIDKVFYEIEGIA